MQCRTRLELIALPQVADRSVTNKVEDSDVGLARLAADWMSNVFGLAEIQALPDIRRFATGRLTFLSRSGTVSDAFADTSVVDYQRLKWEIAAHYDDSARTIYLPESWDGSTPAQMSVLVHAMAHHFQRVSRKYYDRPQERKYLPYEAQERWLGLYDRSLAEDFKIDAAMLMLITQCVP
jgi:Domain of unknown function (DUF6647)